MDYIKKNASVIILIIGFLGLVIYNWDKLIVTDSDQTMIYNDKFINVTIKGEVLKEGEYQIEEYKNLGQLVDLAGGTTDNADVSSLEFSTPLEEGMTIIIPELESEDTYEYPEDIIKIKVEVKGEVVNPGLYELYNNSRVNDLISAAGGFTELANTDEINGARILVDGETLFVPKTELESLEESSETEEVRDIYVEITGKILNPGIYLIPENFSLQDLIYEAGGVTPDCDLSKINWDVTLCLGATIYIPGYDDTVEIEAESDLININTADLEELMDLPGIGEILGQRIIDYRKEHGDFQAIEDIMFVSGIKDTIYEKIKESITV